MAYNDIHAPVRGYREVLSHVVGFPGPCCVVDRYSCILDYGLADDRRIATICIHDTNYSKKKKKSGGCTKF